MNITTLIPAYKIQYITPLLEGLRAQTMPSARIIISDDSPGGIFRDALFSNANKPLLAGLNIEFVDGPRNGGYGNVKHLLNVWDRSSELVHVMLDDDVIYPEFYERHFVAHQSAKLSISISRRWSAREDGQPYLGQLVPPAIAQNPARILMLGPEVTFMTTIPKGINWFGEFSNAVLHADSCELLNEPVMGGVSYAGLWDIGFFLSASMKAPIGYIQDHLGYFRTGGGNNSSHHLGPFMKAAHLAWIALAICGQRVGHINAAQALAGYQRLAPQLARCYLREPDMRIFCELMPQLLASMPGAEDHFLTAWTQFLKDKGFD